MITVIMACGLFVGAPDDDGKKDPRSELDTAIPYFIRLLETEKYAEFVDKAVYPSRLKDYLEQMSREKLAEDVGKTRQSTIELLHDIQKLKGEPFKPLSKEYEAGMKYRLPNDMGIFSFYKRKGLWYGAF